MKIFFAAAAAAKPEHSLYNAIFWLLVLLAVLVATVALKIVFGIVDREIEFWRAGRKNRQRVKTARRPTTSHHKKENHDQGCL